MKWRRPYSGGPFQLLAGSFLVFGMVFFIWVAVLIFASSDPIGRKALALVGLVSFATVSVAFAWRVYRAGVLVSDEGLRVRGFVRTITVQWADVRAVRLAPLKLPGWVFWVQVPPGNQAIWIDRGDGPALQTAVNNQSAQFLGRRGEFERVFHTLQWELDERKGGGGRSHNEAPTPHR
jgi:hypothetical protein